MDKWNCKVGNCTVADCAKWLLTKHLKEVHGLVAEKSKPGKPSTAAGAPRHQDHAKMNVRILGNAMVVQRRNDQKVECLAQVFILVSFLHLAICGRSSWKRWACTICSSPKCLHFCSPSYWVEWQIHGASTTTSMWLV